MTDSPCLCILYWRRLCLLQISTAVNRPGIDIFANLLGIFQWKAWKIKKNLVGIHHWSHCRFVHWTKDELEDSPWLNILYEWKLCQWLCLYMYTREVDNGLTGVMTWFLASWNILTRDRLWEKLVMGGWLKKQLFTQAQRQTKGTRQKIQFQIIYFKKFPENFQ